MIKAVFFLEKLNKEKLKDSLELGINAVFCNYRNLRQEWIEKFHENNVKVYVEIGLFVGEDLLKKYPDSRPVAKNGQKPEKTNLYAGLCPNHQKIRQGRLEQIKKILQNFEIDGIWLDFVRYPCHWEDVRDKNITEYCFCKNCLDQFAKTIGGWPEGLKWYWFKNRQVTLFVKDVKKIVKESKKKIKLGVFTVPWKKNEFNGAIKKIICQDFSALSKQVDIFTPMVYHKMLDRKTEWISEYVNYLYRLTKKPILPIVQTENKPAKLGKEEFVKEVKTSLQKPSAGTIVFFYEDLIKDKDKLKLVKRYFK